MPTAQHGEVTLEYVVDGDPEDVPLLLINGLGGQLIAWDAELECLHVEIIRDVQDDALNAVRLLGAIDGGVQRDGVKDQHGNLHDLIFMRIPLGRWWQWSQF